MSTPNYHIVLLALFCCWLYIICMQAGIQASSSDRFDLIYSSSEINGKIPLQLPLACQNNGANPNPNTSTNPSLQFALKGKPDNTKEALCYENNRLSNIPNDIYSPKKLVERSVLYSKNLNCDAENINHLDALFRKIGARYGDSSSINSNSSIKSNNNLKNTNTERVEEVHIYVMGGSLTAGRNVGGFDSAWPALLEKMLNQKLQTIAPVRFLVHNVAEPATSSTWALNRLSSLIPADEPVDIVIVDYDVNDCAFMSNTSESRGNYLSATEILIRRLLLHNGNPAIMFLNVAVSFGSTSIKSTCDLFPTCYSMNEIRLPLLSAYGVPSVSQRQAIWERFECAPYEALWPCRNIINSKVGSCSHPSPPAHFLLADLVFGFISGRSFVNGKHGASSDSYLNPDPNPDSRSKTPPTKLNKLMGIRDDDVLGIADESRSKEGEKNVAAALIKNPSGPGVYSKLSSVWAAKYTPAMNPENPVRSFCRNQKNNNNNGRSIKFTASGDDYFYSSSKAIERFFCKDMLSELAVERSSMVGKSILRSENAKVEPGALVDGSRKLCWDYSQDVEGKPGWISQNCPDGSIYFKIRFGDAPKLTIVYLSSYSSDWGSALFSIGLPDPSSKASSTAASSTIAASSMDLEPFPLAFFPIGIIQGRRTMDAEWKRASVSTSHLFCPQSFLNFYLEQAGQSYAGGARLNNSLFLTTAFDKNIESKIAGKEAILKVEPSGGNKYAKFKLITVMTC